MREIKFRAWDKKSESICRVYSMHMEPSYSSGCLSIQRYDKEKEKEERGILFGAGYWSEDRKKEDVILMQYTGLKDKKGVEIYEGDVVTCPISGKSADYLQLEANDKDFVMRGISIPEIYQEGIPDDCEVIGNIYENKV